MGDQTDAIVPEQEAGQPLVEGSQEPSGAVQPQYITLEEVQRLTQEAEERAFRRAQGLLDKNQQRVRDGLNGLAKQLESLRSVGVQLTPDQEKQLERNVLNEAYLPEPQPAPQAGKVQPEAGQAVPADLAVKVEKINAIADYLAETAGIDIDEGDPEYSTLIMLPPENPEAEKKFLESFRSALEAKKQRLSTQPPTQVGVQPRSPTNLGGVGGRTNPILENTDSSDLIKMGLDGPK